MDGQATPDFARTSLLSARSRSETRWCSATKQSVRPTGFQAISRGAGSTAGRPEPPRRPNRSCATAGRRTALRRARVRSIRLLLAADRCLAIRWPARDFPAPFPFSGRRFIRPARKKVLREGACSAEFFRDALQTVLRNARVFATSHSVRRGSALTARRAAAGPSGGKLPKSPGKPGDLRRRTLGKYPRERRRRSGRGTARSRARGFRMGAVGAIRTPARPLDSPRGVVEYCPFPCGSRFWAIPASRRWGVSRVRRGRMTAFPHDSAASANTPLHRCAGGSDAAVGPNPIGAVQPMP